MIRVSKSDLILVIQGKVTPFSPELKMRTKRRIIKICDKFYPQYKFRFWWIHYTEYNMIYDQSFKISFNSFDEANDFIEDLRTPGKKIEIIKEYD